jgi:hypothetical protein
MSILQHQGQAQAATAPTSPALSAAMAVGGADAANGAVLSPLGLAASGTDRQIDSTGGATGALDQLGLGLDAGASPSSSRLDDSTGGASASAVDLSAALEAAAAVAAESLLDSPADISSPGVASDPSAAAAAADAPFICRRSGRHRRANTCPSRVR